jgi:hypothetical protein
MDFRYTKCENGEWTGMDEVTVKGHIFVNKIVNPWDPQKSANFLTCLPNTNFWGTKAQLFEALSVSLCPYCCWYVVNKRTYDCHVNGTYSCAELSITLSSSSSSALQFFMSFGLLNYFFPLFPLLHPLFPVLHSHLHHAIKALNKRDFPASGAGCSAPQLTEYSTHCIGH